MSNGSGSSAGLESADAGRAIDLGRSGGGTDERRLLATALKTCEALQEHKAADALRDVLARFSLPFLLPEEARLIAIERFSERQRSSEAPHGEAASNAQEVTDGLEAFGDPDLPR